MIRKLIMSRIENKNEIEAQKNERREEMERR